MVNPYFNQSFLGFFLVFVQRLFALLTGKIQISELCIDEIQIFSLSMLAVSCGLIGSFLVLRKMTMLANALSHTILPAIVGAFLLFQKGFFEDNALGPLLFASIVAAIATTFLTQFFMHRFKLAPDSSIGLVFTTLFALGIVMVTLFTKNVHIGLESVMGNVDMLHIDDLQFAFATMIINVVLIILFYKEYQIISFDPSFSQVSGIQTRWLHYLLMLQVALTCVVAFRAVGVILVLSFLVAPVMTARMLTHELKKMLVVAILIGIAEAIIGVALARHLLTEFNLAVSTGGLIVTMQGLTFFIIAFYKNSSFFKKPFLKDIGIRQ